jgi:hypothetical protein
MPRPAALCALLNNRHPFGWLWEPKHMSKPKTLLEDMCEHALSCGASGLPARTDGQPE